jgi:protein gp37
VKKTKIDWCDMSWNPVSGCYHSCKYCYAKKIAKRFAAKYVCEYENNNFILSDKAAKYIINPETSEGNILMAQHKPIFKNIGILDEQDRRYTAFPFGFCPTLHTQRLNEPQKVKKSQRIFVVSMGDLFGDWVPDEWIQEVFKACEAAPWHKYLFLTKNPKRYYNWFPSVGSPQNFWLGTTVGQDANTSHCRADIMGSFKNSFLSIEPLLDDVARFIDFDGISWVIVGAETGNRSNKVFPKKEWVNSIVVECRKNSIPVFMKDSLRDLMSHYFVQQWPERLKGDEIICKTRHSLQVKK